MDLATLLGIIIGFVMVVIGIITSTTNPTLKGIMDTFVDIPSIAVTTVSYTHLTLPTILLV